MKQKYRSPKRSDKKAAASVAPKPIPRAFSLIAITLIILCGFMAYVNSLHGQFIYDDELYVEHNSFIKAPFNLADFFTKDIGQGGGAQGSYFYRPLQMVSYALEYRISRLNVTTFHLTNTIIHLGSAVCLFWLINLLFTNELLAFLTALFFAVHPIQTEAVSYISGRCDPMAGLFMLLTMIFYIKTLPAPQISRLCLVFFFYACALLSKESSMILPALMLFYHWVFQKRVKAFNFLVLISPLIIYAILRLTLIKVLIPHTSTDNMGQRLPGFFVAIFNYIRLLLFPLGLHMEYGAKTFPWTEPKAILGIILVAAILIAGYLHRNNRLIVFSLGWFFIALIPVSNLYRIDFYMAEHFLYLPSIGFFVLAAYGLNNLYKNPRYKTAALVLIPCLVLACLVLTIKQNHYWHDSVDFYQQTIKWAPDSSNAYNNLGRIYETQGHLDEAMKDFTKAIEFKPNNPQAYTNRGSVEDREGKYIEAIADFTKAISLNPYFTESYINRGSSYGKKGDLDRAIADFDKTIELEHNSPEAYNDLGNAYFLKGNYPKALVELNKALSLNPNLMVAYYNRSHVNEALGHHQEALNDLHQAENLDARARITSADGRSGR